MVETSGKNADARMQEVLIKTKKEPPPWSRDRLQAIPKEKYIHLKSFVNKRHRTHQGVVAFKDVDCFISSVGDIEMDWHSLLRICHKNKLAERFLWSADYWIDPTRKEGHSFVTLDDHLLISQGLYKTALARYVLHYHGEDSLYGVKVSQWTVDWEMYGIWLELKGLCREKYPHYVITPEKKKIASHKDGHNMIDEYLLTLSRKDKKSGEVVTLGNAGAKDWLEDLRTEQGEPRFKLEELKEYALAA